MEERHQLGCIHRSKDFSIWLDIAAFPIILNAGISIVKWKHHLFTAGLPYNGTALVKDGNLSIPRSQSVAFMEGRDIGTNVFPETDFKYYLDAKLEERARRRAADGLQENLAQRDQRDSQRAVAPLMIALGAKVINNSQMTPEQTSGTILADIRQRLAAAARAPDR